MARPKKETAAEPKAAAPEAASAKVNKSLAVRDYLALHPKATPKDVSAALKDQGLDVSPNYVSIVKFQMKKSPAQIARCCGIHAQEWSSVSPLA